MGSTTLVAVMVTVCGELITEGAVYNPPDRLPTTGFMDQVTAVFDVPLTVEVNCLVSDGARVVVEGLTLMLIMGTS